ncbi:MAG: OmpA family protein [Planctomycetota bacterium]
MVIDRKKWAGAALVALLAGAGVGCVSQEQYDNVTETNRTLEDRNQQLVAELEESKGLNAQYEQDRARSERALADLRSNNAELIRQRNDSDQALRDFEQRLGEVAFGPLDPETDRALAALDREAGDLIEYDAEQGRLRFASDLTFGSGSDQLSQTAKDGLGRLAEVLKSSDGLQYEIVVVGHTDSVPISNPGTRQRHPTNVHLSAHRAISVRSQLVQMGVPATRIGIMGWGEHRPAVQNNARGGTAQNRRVEVYLTRPTGNTPAPAPAETSPQSGASTRAPGEGVEPTK